jgi:hypothetical protein
MFTVIWRDSALDALAARYVAADLSTQDAIANCVEQFNRILADDPLNFGESRSGHRRIGFIRPCAITFMVDHPDDAPNVVRVTHFWTY